MRRASIRVFALVAVLAIAGLSVSMVGLAGPTVTVSACFSDVGGLDVGDPVMVRGVDVGRVSSIRLNGQYRPCADLSVDAELALSDDTSASILSLNVLGDRCVDLEPGGSSVLLREGDELTYTQGSIAIERMLSRIIDEL